MNVFCPCAALFSDLKYYSFQLQINHCTQIRRNNIHKDTWMVILHVLATIQFNLLSCSLPLVNVKNKIQKTTILRIPLHGCQTWYQTLEKDIRLSDTAEPRGKKQQYDGINCIVTGYIIRTPPGITNRLLEEEPFSRSSRFLIWSINSPPYMKLKCSLSCSQNPATGPCPQPLILPSKKRVGFPSHVFSSGFPTKILHRFLESPMRITCHGHTILLDLMILTTSVIIIFN